MNEKDLEYILERAELTRRACRAVSSPVIGTQTCVDVENLVAEVRRLWALEAEAYMTEATSKYIVWCPKEPDEDDRSPGWYKCENCGELGFSEPWCPKCGEGAKEVIELAKEVIGLAKEGLEDSPCKCRPNGLGPGKKLECLRCMALNRIKGGTNAE